MKNTSRAYTPEQKKAILDQLLTEWLKVPNLRLGQLLDAATYAESSNLFFIEDEALCVIVARYVRKVSGG